MFQQKNILLVSRNFWPDRSSCSSILFNVAKYFSEKKNKVEIITSFPKKYNIQISKEQLFERDKGHNLKINRINLFKENRSAFSRIFNALLLAGFGSLELNRKKYDVVIVTSTPPILTAFILCIFCKIYRKKFIYYCMDINPEIGIISGDFKNRLLIKMMMKIDNWTCKNSSKVVVHSYSMKKTILKRNLENKINISIINSFAETKFEKEPKDYFSESIFLKKGLNIIYAGNLGRFQGLGSVIKSFSLIKKYSDIRLILLGEGEEKEKLKNLSRELEANVIFVDYVPQSKSKFIINKADLGLVSLTPNIHKYAYPSKFMAYLEQGIPVIGLIEEKSDLAKDIKRNNVGFVLPLHDHSGLKELLINLKKDFSWKRKLKTNSLKAFEKEFSKDVILSKWEDLI